MCTVTSVLLNPGAVLYRPFCTVDNALGTDRAVVLKRMQACDAG